MSEDYRLSKIEILLQQKKYNEAERILKDLLAEDSNNIHFLSLLAEVNIRQDKPEIANNIIDTAIGLSPDNPYLYYIKSRICLHLDNFNDAEKYIDQAISIDPFEADYFAFHGNIKLIRKKYDEALDLADHALEIDPENLLALNTRSTALLKLDDKEASFATIEGALREDPNNSYTHANYGWGLLEKGDHKKALEHFRESLKNDPDSTLAQAGVLESIKAGNPLYRLFLKYSFWIGNLAAKYQWAFIIGFYFGVKFLRTIANNNPSLAPFLTPVIIGLAIFAFSTWVMNPISNLFLRFNKYGQLLLSNKEKMSSNFVAVSLVICLVGTISYFALSDIRFLSVAAFGFAMMVPCSVMFSPAKYKYSLLVFTIAMAIIGSLAIAVTFSTGEIFNQFSTIFLFAFIAFQWVANFLVIRESNR